MNILATDKRAQILNCLVEGCSMRATSRLTGAAKKTVERLLVSAGEACLKYHDGIMRNLNCKTLQVDDRQLCPSHRWRYREDSYRQNNFRGRRCRRGICPTSYPQHGTSVAQVILMVAGNGGARGFHIIGRDFAALITP